MTVEHLLNVISITELIEWQTFLRIERQELEKEREPKPDQIAPPPATTEELDEKARQVFTPYRQENPLWQKMESRSN